MNERQSVAAFGALAQETRLRILRMLVQAGPEGMAAGAVALRADVSPSNVSFHLKELERAGLCAARRVSRSIIYSAEFDAISALIRFLMQDCCDGRPEICGPVIDAATCCPPRSEIRNGA